MMTTIRYGNGDIADGAAGAEILHDDDEPAAGRIVNAARIIQRIGRRRAKRAEEAVNRLQRGPAARQVGPLDPRPLRHHDVGRPNRQGVMGRIGRGG